MNIKKIDILLILISTTLTLVFGLSLIRWLQPSLLGISEDMVLVKSSKELIPYYQNIFRPSDFDSEEFILKDPSVKGRGRQFFPDINVFGPHDILGFRNQSVPNQADIIIIGDSQTYGINAHMQENWPHYFSEHITPGLSVYSMAIGGWGAVQYYYFANRAPAFYPKIIIIAFYTGNDPLETFSMVYGSDIWNKYVKNTSLSKNDVPEVAFPAPINEQWEVNFKDGVKTVFTPQLRHASNKKHPAVDAAYELMVDFSKMISAFAKENNVQIMFTIIPTKEYVYSKKVKLENIEINSAYSQLIKDEGYRIDNFSKQLQSISGAVYVDVINDLQNEALKNKALYPSGKDGHPLSRGYKVIGQTIAREVNKLVKPEILNGTANILDAEGNIDIVVYIDGRKYWIIESPQEIQEPINTGQTVLKQQLEGHIYMGHLTPQQFNNRIK